MAKRNRLGCAVAAVMVGCAGAAFAAATLLFAVVLAWSLTSRGAPSPVVNNPIDPAPAPAPAPVEPPKAPELTSNTKPPEPPSSTEPTASTSTSSSTSSRPAASTKKRASSTSSTSSTSSSSTKTSAETSSTKPSTSSRPTSSAPTSSTVVETSAEPPPPPPPTKSTVSVHVGGSAAVTLIDGDGQRIDAPADVKPGTYQVEAAYPYQAAFPAGKLVAEPGVDMVVMCSAALKGCRIHPY